MIGDYLIESRCRLGHRKEAQFRNYPREHVEDVAHHLSDRCSCPTLSGDPCRAKVSHVITVIPDSDKAIPISVPSFIEDHDPDEDTQPFIEMPRVVTIDPPVQFIDDDL